MLGVPWPADASFSLCFHAAFSLCVSFLLGGLGPYWIRGSPDFCTTSSSMNCPCRLTTASVWAHANPLHSARRRERGRCQRNCGCRRDNSQVLRARPHTGGVVVRGANVFLLGFVTWAPTILALEKPGPRQTPVCRPQLSGGPLPMRWGKTILSDGFSC